MLRKPLFLVAIALVTSIVQGLIVQGLTAQGQVYDTPEKAQSDPDFAVQGEYVQGARGLQVIALGNGTFEAVLYPGGLPGAGSNGNDKQRLEMDSEQLASMLEKYERVQRKSPTLGSEPPQGAVVLFDGTAESLERHWQSGARMTDDGLLMQGCTSVDTFGDYSMHLEFRLPFMPSARGQGRGNSGVYHQGRYETQVLDSFGLEGKQNEAGGLYSIRDPDVNMCFPPMVWQTYDVDFLAARYDATGKKTDNAKITVKLNGVIVQRDVELPHSTTAAPLGEGADDGPIHLQDHGNPVRYRNIWVRPRDLKAEARRPLIPGFERFHSSGVDLVQGGRLLMGELNCVACHRAEQNLVDLIRPKQAPILDNIGERAKPEWIIKFIANPHDTKPGTTMPDLLSDQSEEQRKQAAIALTHFLVGSTTIRAGGNAGNTNQGERLFHESGCIACHAPRDGRPVSASTSVPLVGLDEKYTRASLEEFLKNPLAVRPSGRMPHVNLGGDNWRHVAQYLTGDESVSFARQRDFPKEPNLRFSAYFMDVDRLPDLDDRKPDKTGVSRGLDIGVGQRTENVVISFSGYLPIKQSGQYTFRLSSDDGSRLILDGKKVIDNDGIHPNESRETSIRLTEGMHELRVDWFEKGGEEWLALDWTGPGIPPSPIDKALVMNRDDSLVPVQNEPDPVDPDEYVFDEAKAQQGRELFSKLGCASCHVSRDERNRVASSIAAPVLKDCRADQGCLASSRPSSAPNYDLVATQLDAINAALAAGTANLESTADIQVSHAMKSLNCFACHGRDGNGGPQTDRNEFFISTIPEMGDEGRLPPPLDGIGDKLREDWIRQVIANGDKSRPYMRTIMPGFGGDTASHLTSLFASLDARTEANITRTDESQNRKVALGRKMVGSTGLSCVSCHTFGRFRATGIQAIGLDTMAQRIREDWFHRYMPNPPIYRPGTRMPSGYPEGKSTVTDIYDGDPQQQIAAMWAYLEQGIKGGVPEGITGGMIELKPDDKPVIYRNFIDGVSSRGIAIGYPEKANLCWDADTMSLALIWQDRFIDASMHWIGRGQGRQIPLGGNSLFFEKVSPVAALADASDPWPTDAPKQRGYRFLGYRLDEQGRPTFRYQTPQATVEDTPLPVAGEFAASFNRRVTIVPKGDGNGATYFRAASGNVEPQADGSYLIDRAITVSIESSDAEPITRNVNGSTEVLVPIEGPTTIHQHIVW